MTDEVTDKPDKAGKGFTPMKRIVACIFGLFLVGCAATQPPSDKLVIVRSSPAPASESTAAAQPRTITGKVVGVIDGDTITVLDEQQRQHKVGLFGIDAP